MDTTNPNQDYVPRAPMNSPRSLISASSTLSFSSDCEVLTLASETSILDEEESFDWFDKFLHFIARRKRKLFIDTDGQSQIISVEESKKRLLYFSLGLTIVLWLVANIMLGGYINIRVSSKGTIYLPAPMTSNKNESMSMPIPKIALIDSMGSGYLYKYVMLKNQSFGLEWTLKLPSSQTCNLCLFTSYSMVKFTGYVANKNLHILRLDGKIDGTIIYSNNTHRKMPKSKFIYKDAENLFPTSVVMTQKFLWVFGTTLLNSPNAGRKSYFWSIHRKKWLKGPTLPNPVNVGCGVAQNRSHVTLFTLPHEMDDPCIRMWTYDLIHQIWTTKESCYISFETTLSSNSIVHRNIESSLIFDKNGEM